MMKPEVQAQIEKVYSQNMNPASTNWAHFFSAGISDADRLRVQQEFSGAGPLEILLKDEKVTEILVNDFNKIFYEIEGALYTHPDRFFSLHSYMNFIDRLCEKCGRPFNRERPFLEFQAANCRYSLVFGELASGHPILSIRKQNLRPFKLADLTANNWCEPQASLFITGLVKNKKNILVVGATSSGKTTTLQALLGAVLLNERCVVVEDTKELTLPNSASVSLLSREFSSGAILPVSLEDLIRRALRLRPDRMIVGEVRGAEAYALLLALSTGHKGSLSSLHAATAKQALLRLEMLVQLGAPDWDLRSIRRLITLSLDYIIAVEKTDSGRKLKEICEIKSVEEHGIILEKIF
jgi:pilus assembly protein CpaF